MFVVVYYLFLYLSQNLQILTGLNDIQVLFAK